MVISSSRCVLMADEELIEVKFSLSPAPIKWLTIIRRWAVVVVLEACGGGDGGDNCVNDGAQIHRFQSCGNERPIAGRPLTAKLNVNRTISFIVTSIDTTETVCVRER